jgi:LuxR family maltose regulon positive regulatory protein
VDYLATLDRAARRELGRTGQAPARPPRAALRDPLSGGESAVLPLLPTELTYAEIAAQRYVSVNTVKSQLKSIYRKLGVRSRVAAVERCRELGLLVEGDVHPHG